MSKRAPTPLPCQVSVPLSEAALQLPSFPLFQKCAFLTFYDHVISFFFLVAENKQLNTFKLAEQSSKEFEGLKNNN